MASPVASMDSTLAILPTWLVAPYVLRSARDVPQHDMSSNAFSHYWHDARRTVPKMA